MPNQKHFEEKFEAQKEPPADFATERREGRWRDAYFRTGSDARVVAARFVCDDDIFAVAATRKDAAYLELDVELPPAIAAMCDALERHEKVIYNSVATFEPCLRDGTVLRVASHLRDRGASADAHMYDAANRPLGVPERAGDLVGARVDALVLAGHMWRFNARCGFAWYFLGGKFVAPGETAGCTDPMCAHYAHAYGLARGAPCCDKFVSVIVA